MAEVIHQLEDENTRLRTKLAFLDKENMRLNNYIVEGQSASGNLCSKNFMGGGERESSSILINLKKLLRQAREQIAVLEDSNVKLKRTVKYTKINELEIEQKALLDETGRLKAIVDELVGRQNEQTNQRTKLASLTHELKCQVQQNENLLDMKDRYEQAINTLERRIKEVEDISIDREGKLLKDLKEARLRIQDNLRKQEIYKNYIATLVEEKEVLSKQHQSMAGSMLQQKGRSTFGKQNRNLTGSAIRPATAAGKRPESAMRSNLKAKNQHLVETVAKGRDTDDWQNTTTKKPFIPAIPLSSAEREKARNQPVEPPTNKSRQDKKTETRSQEMNTPNSEHEATVFQQIKVNLDKLFQKAVKQEAGSDSRKLIASSKAVALNKPQLSDDSGLDNLSSSHDNYGEDFEQQEQKVDAAEEYGNDFQQEQEKSGQEILFSKEQKKPKKKKKVKSNPLAQLSELLALRLRAQQYPLNELLEDIRQSCPEVIDIAQLADLLQKEPFYLNHHLVDTMLQTIFGAEKLSSHLTINTQNFAKKLTSIVMPYDLPTFEEQEALAQQIHDKLSQHWEDLISGLDRQSNKDGTITRAALQKQLTHIGLTYNEIEVVLCDLSLSCLDLDHLQYLNIYQIYFEQREQMIYEEAEEQEQQDFNRRHTIRQEHEEESMSNDRHPPRKQQLPIKNSSFSMRGGSVADVGELSSGLV